MLVYLLVSCLLYVSCVATQHEETMNKWVVLVAGSNGWYNYRHQADVAHAYHLLIKRGIPAEKIITFAFDDIANNEENPFPGQIFNDYNHTDYYKGFKIDYKGKDVTPQMFLSVLKGDPSLKNMGKKVLESGPEDNVFVYFTDHGAPLILAFPYDDLEAKDLNETIHYMHNASMYKKMVFYIEACESGSMFENILPKNLNVYATTAANSTESSWATFCEDPKVGTCLADEYSYNWMVNSERHNPRKHTLGRQFKDVRKMTIKSHVQQYGDQKMSKLTISEFQGSNQADVSTHEHQETRDNVPSTQAHIHGMMRSVMQARSNEEHSLAKRTLTRAIKLGELAVETMDLIVDTVSFSTATKTLNMASVEQGVSCYSAAYQSFKRHCFTIQRVPEVAKQLKKLLNLCQQGVPTSDIVKAIGKICQ